MWLHQNFGLLHWIIPRICGTSLLNYSNYHQKRSSMEWRWIIMSYVRLMCGDARPTPWTTIVRMGRNSLNGSRARRGVFLGISKKHSSNIPDVADPLDITLEKWLNVSKNEKSLVSGQSNDRRERSPVSDPQRIMVISYLPWAMSNEQWLASDIWRQETRVLLSRQVI